MTWTNILRQIQKLENLRIENDKITMRKRRDKNE